MRRLTTWALVATLLATGTVRYLRAQTGIPTPASVIGFEPCADYKLATYEQVAAYFQALDNSTDRMALVEIGETAEGRTQLMAIISSEANLQRLERIKAIASRLANARGTYRCRGARAGSGRPSRGVDRLRLAFHRGRSRTNRLTGGRTGPSRTTRTRCRPSGTTSSFLLLPNMNPDGTTLVAEWYMKYVGTRYEQTSPPELYQKYAGHDNNRDWFMFNLPESRNVAKQLLCRVVSPDCLQPAPNCSVPRPHLRSAVRRPDEPKYPAARHARSQPGW